MLPPSPTFLRICVTLSLLFAAILPHARAAINDDFTSLDNWTTYKAGSGSLDASSDTDGNLRLATESTDESGTRTIRIVTKTPDPDLNFTSRSESDAPLVFAVKNLAIQSRGATASFQIGLTSDPANANIYTRANSLYFAQNGTANATLAIRDDGQSTTLWSTKDRNLLAFNYAAITLTLTSTTWAFTLHDTTGHPLVSEQGPLPSLQHRAWKSPLHAHITLNQSTNNNATATLLIDSITTAPIR